MRYTLFSAILLFISCTQTNNVEVKKYCTCLNEFSEIHNANNELEYTDKILFIDSLRDKGDLLIDCLGGVDFAFETEEEKAAFFSSLARKCAHTAEELNLPSNN